MPKTTQYTYDTPHRVSQKYIGLHNIYFLNLKKYCITLPKPRKNAIPSLAYIVNTMG
jgi:hypothetical protein